jgi:hypothetical protein
MVLMAKIARRFKDQQVCYKPGDFTTRLQPKFAEIEVDNLWVATVQLRGRELIVVVEKKFLPENITETSVIRTVFRLPGELRIEKKTSETKVGYFIKF